MSFISVYTLRNFYSRFPYDPSNGLNISYPSPYSCLYVSLLQWCSPAPFSPSTHFSIISILFHLPWEIVPFPIVLGLYQTLIIIYIVTCLLHRYLCTDSFNSKTILSDCNDDEHLWQIQAQCVLLLGKTARTFLISKWIQKQIALCFKNVYPIQS